MAGEAATNEGIQIPGEAGPNYEEIARNKGWRPLEEFEGDQGTWVGAEEFVKREPLFEKIKNQSKELRELRKTIDSMSSHYHKSVEVAVKRAVDDLKAKRREAIELGDVEKVEAIDNEIEKTKNDAAEAAPAKNADPDIPEEITTWIGENKWYESNDEMRTFAIAYNEQFLRKNPGKLEESLKKTTEAVKRAFPEEFDKRNPKRDLPGAVETPSAANNGGSTKQSVDRLTAEQKLVYNQYVKVHKIMSHEEYFKSLEEIGELK